jgi:phosphoglycerate dehydrogenase-like enzyme
VNVLVLIHSEVAVWNIPAGHVERLARTFPAHRFLHAPGEAEARAFAPEADAAFSGQLSRDLLASAPRLRWIHSPAAGIGSMLYPEMLARDIVLTNSRGMSADTIAEHVLAVTLALFRRLPLAIRSQDERRWAQDEMSAPPSNRMLRGARVLVVGFGAIGQAAAARMTALGARVVGVRRRATADAPPGVEGIYTPEHLGRLLPTADVVVIAAPQTRETVRVIDAAAIARMKADAVLVNVSRGKLVDERALAAALAQRRIGGAALDVFEHEPLSPESPLWALPNVLITPHTSGFRPDHWDAATALFAENLRRFDRGEPLLNVVDKAAGY